MCRPSASAFLRMVSRDRKSTRLNSSHLGISHAVFCLKKIYRNGDLGRRFKDGSVTLLCRVSGHVHTTGMTEATAFRVRGTAAGGLWTFLFFFFKESGNHRNLLFSPTSRPTD